MPTGAKTGYTKIDETDSSQSSLYTRCYNTNISYDSWYSGKGNV